MDRWGAEPRVTQDKHLTAERPDIACRRRGGERGEQAALGPEPKEPSEPCSCPAGHGRDTPGPSNVA